MEIEAFDPSGTPIVALDCEVNLIRLTLADAILYKIQETLAGRYPITLRMTEASHQKTYLANHSAFYLNQIWCESASHEALTLQGIIKADIAQLSQIQPPYPLSEILLKTRALVDTMDILHKDAMHKIIMKIQLDPSLTAFSDTLYSILDLTNVPMLLSFLTTASCAGALHQSRYRKCEAISYMNYFLDVMTESRNIQIIRRDLQGWDCLLLKNAKYHLPQAVFSDIEDRSRIVTSATGQFLGGVALTIMVLLTLKTILQKFNTNMSNDKKRDST